MTASRGIGRGGPGVKKKPGTGAKISAAKKGRKLSPEHCAAISAAAKKRPPVSAETRAKLSAMFKGRPGQTPSEEARAKMRAAKLGKPGPWAGKKRGPLSAEWRANISKGNMGKPAYYPNRRFYYKDIPFRSSWEVFVAKAFDNRGIAWQYEPCKFDLGTETYTPDFYLPEQDVYWEVKGYFGPQSRKTVELFRRKFPELPLVVATASVLKALDPSFNPRIRFEEG